MATEIGQKAALLVQRRRASQALTLISPILTARTPFRLLDRIGASIGAGEVPGVNDFLGEIAATKAEGAWVVIGSALGQQLDRDLAGALRWCREFIVAADVWYGADILAERVPGPGLVANLNSTMKLLAPWREDGNRWVRRSVGVGVHFWAKRSLGMSEHAADAEKLLAFLEPMFEERDLDAIKGVGRGLEKLGKYYPRLQSEWLANQVHRRQRLPSALMLRKSLTYLTPKQRAQANGTAR